MRWVLLPFALALGVIELVAAWQPDAVLVIGEGSVAPDCTPRQSTVINGTSPGPILRFRAGDHVFIRVHNTHRDQNATVHWHGLSQYASPFSDGTPLASQWPIAPGQFFDYEFSLGEDSVGSYFYHAHVGLQTMLAHGGFIVDEPVGHSPPYAYDEERVILLADYYHASDTNITKGLLADPFGARAGLHGRCGAR
jgi:L-ascorbate oxidase